MVYTGVRIGGQRRSPIWHWCTRYEEPQARYNRSAATLPTSKANNGTVSPDPRTSPASGRSQQRTKASSVRIGPREYTRGGLSHHPDKQRMDTLETLEPNVLRLTLVFTYIISSFKSVYSSFMHCIKWSTLRKQDRCSLFESCVIFDTL